MIEASSLPPPPLSFSLALSPQSSSSCVLSILEDKVFLPALSAMRRGSGCMKLLDLFLIDSLFGSHNLFSF